MTKKFLAILLFLGGIIGIIWYNQVPVDTEQSQILPSETKFLSSTPPKSTITLPTPMTQKTATQAVVNTSMGEFTIVFKAMEVKNTVDNFVKLASGGFYDNTRFHRVIQGFMIQGGDPLSKDLSLKNRWGTGGPGYQFADEIGADNSNDVGTIAMANAGPNTNGSQFFINVVNNTHLNKGHTVFGKVTKGMEVVQKIAATKTDPSDKPIEDVIIKSITLQ